MSRLIDTWKTIRHNGGIWGSIKALFYRDDLKIGKFVGEDEMGNKYYENDKYFYPRNRWVNYSDKVRLEYDASQVPAEWHGWLHNRHDRPPQEQPERPKYPWMAAHTENQSGTRDQYVPYSTTPPKISLWTPPRPQSEDPRGCPPPQTGPDDCGPSEPAECGGPSEPFRGSCGGPLEPLRGSCGEPNQPSDNACGKPNPAKGAPAARLEETPERVCDRSGDKPEPSSREKPTKAFH